jgi:hypothetical protein
LWIVGIKESSQHQRISCRVLSKFPAVCFEISSVCFNPFCDSCCYFASDVQIEKLFVFSKIQADTTFGLISNGCSASSWHDSMQEIPAFKLPVL